MNARLLKVQFGLRGLMLLGTALSHYLHRRAKGQHARAETHGHHHH